MLHDPGGIVYSKMHLLYVVYTVDVISKRQGLDGSSWLTVFLAVLYTQTHTSCSSSVATQREFAH